MTTYVMEARENLSAAQVAIVDAEILAGVGVTYNIATSQDHVGISYDRLNRTLVYSACIVEDPATGDTTPNDTGFALYSGVHTIADAANYDSYVYRNFHILTRTLDSEAVTDYDCWSSTSTVPNGIGPSDGTYRRFVEAHYSTPQVIKLVDPRTRNVWSHHVSVPTGPPNRSCLIYEFRFSENYKQTISPYVPSADRHLELFGINDDWVLVGDLGKLNTGRYAMQLLPRVRTADETTADFLLSYAEFNAPVAHASNRQMRSALDATGNLWTFNYGTSFAVARNYGLYKLAMPTSAPFGGPVVGGGWTTETPWGATTGPNTGTSGYRGFAGASNSTIVHYQPTTNKLVLINKLYPNDKWPVPSTSPADFHFNATLVDLDDMSFTHYADVMTGWVTAALTPTTDPMLAAWAVADCWETDGDLSYHNYTFPDVDYTKRRFFLGVVPVVAGVPVGYPATVPINTTHVLMVEIDFTGVPAWVGARVFDEASWVYPAYAAAIGDTNVVRASMSQGPLGEGRYDVGLWDEQADAWWWSGQNTNFFEFDADFTDRGVPVAYVEQPALMRLSFAETPAATGKGYVRVRYGDL